jgi:hypothetical protein
VLSAQRSLSQATPTCSRKHPSKYLSAGLSPQAALSGEALGECRPVPRGLTRRRIFWETAAFGPTRKTSCSISGLGAAVVAATKVLSAEGIVGWKIGGWPGSKNLLQREPEGFCQPLLSSGGDEYVEEASHGHGGQSEPPELPGRTIPNWCRTN